MVKTNVKGAASKKDLDKLHGLLTKIFTFKLENAVQAIDSIKNNEELDEASLRILTSLSPAELTIITRLLRDNDITFEIDGNAAMSELNEAFDAFTNPNGKTKLPDIKKDLENGLPN